MFFLNMILVICLSFDAVSDPDQDIVRCRWSNVTLNECGNVCNAFPNAILDEVRY